MMTPNSQIINRKNDHIKINLEEKVSSELSNGLEKYRLKHRALPEISLSDIDTSSIFLNKRLGFPILISSMTGGTELAKQINRNLAIMAQRFNIAMGVGSQRVGIENDNSMITFQVREYAPDILVFANLGAVQLNYSYTFEHCQRAVDAIEADALVLHLNPIQEALMVDGNTNFSGLLKKIENICSNMPVPVIVKEVGWGISSEIAGSLIEAGVSAIDVAGAGGTSWSEVEKHRTPDKIIKETANALKDWGIPTAECIVEIRKKHSNIPLIASGGLNNGVEIAKCIALGANLGGMARQFLFAAANSEEELITRAEIIMRQFKIAMFGVGAGNLDEMRKEKIQRLF